MAGLGAVRVDDYHMLEQLVLMVHYHTLVDLCIITVMRASFSRHTEQPGFNNHTNLYSNMNTGTLVHSRRNENTIATVIQCCPLVVVMLRLPPALGRQLPIHGSGISHLFSLLCSILLYSLLRLCCALPVLILLHITGTQRRSYLFVEDVARGFEAIVRKVLS